MFQPVNTKKRQLTLDMGIISERTLMMQRDLVLKGNFHSLAGVHPSSS